MKTQTVLAIGAHIGDAELTAGALLASCAVHGGKAVTLALTAGEKGAPAGADIAEYRRENRGGRGLCQRVGGEAYVLITKTACCRTMTRFALPSATSSARSSLISSSPTTKTVCTSDHIVCHRIVVDAWFYARH